MTKFTTSARDACGYMYVRTLTNKVLGCDTHTDIWLTSPIRIDESKILREGFEPTMFPIVARMRHLAIILHGNCHPVRRE